MRRILVVGLSGMMLSANVCAHHSFAPHYDASKQVSISGKITEFERRNPHAYLHVLAPDGDGVMHEYVCESHGVTQLERNGISTEMLAPGTLVTLTGSQARRDPYRCFFNLVTFADGTTLNVNGPDGRGPTEAGSVARIAVPLRDSMFGSWLLVPANRSTSGPQPMLDYLTPAGEAATATYDPFTDDPTFRCEPVGIRRVWFAPGTPMAIEQRGDDIVLRHEWMDVARTIHMNQAAVPDDTPPSVLGYSRGHYEGDTLVIETSHYSAGVMSQYVEQPGKPTRGMLHSAALTSVERLRFNPDSQRVELTMEFSDPEYFTRDFPAARAEYGATTMVIKPFGCRPENADHSLRNP